MSNVAAALSEWMPQQRWYSAKGVTPRLRVIATIDSSADDANIVIAIVLDEGPEKPVLYQVPVTVRADALPGLDPIAIIDGLYMYDGPHDPAFARVLIESISAESTIGGDGASATGSRLSAPGRVTSSRVLEGEQSNTSIICEVEGGSAPTLIAKVFRVLHHGENPDVSTQAALTAHGSTRVPRTVGSAMATWPDSGRAAGTATGHLAIVQEFLPGLQDAWRVALAAAAAGDDFASRAFDLGVATAEVHATLATALPTLKAGPAEVAAATATMRRRLDIAASEVASIAPFYDRILALYASIESLSWPTLQRIHGDLHLGQVLSTNGRDWLLLDFEGEPLRPMFERSRPDVPLRDIAGMLRSFDYVAGSLERSVPPVDAHEWAHRARAAYIDGYVATSGVDVRADRALLDAFEIDKAVYESIYEVRNRPDWVEIPRVAIERLIARSSHSVG